MIEVNSLWIGDSLSNMERMAINSHIANGHRYRLWTYNRVRGVPDGAIVEDGNEILPQSEVFAYQVGDGKGSFSAFSNFFRYKLIMERGGWWADTDVVCLKPFDFSGSYVFATERGEHSPHRPTSCVFKAPAGSAVITYCWEFCKTVDRETLDWGTVGPNLIAKAVFSFDLNHFCAGPTTFCPIDWFNVNKLFEDQFLPVGHAVHLWNEMWRRNRIDKNGVFLHDCLYEQLKRLYLKDKIFL